MTSSEDIAYADPERRLRRLLRRLPGRMQAITRWLRKPASRWARIPAGILLIIGGCLAILPIFGLWMFPLGLVLLADDIPPLRRLRDRALDWLERRRPNWFCRGGARAIRLKRRSGQRGGPSLSLRENGGPKERMRASVQAFCPGEDGPERLRRRASAV